MEDFKDVEWTIEQWAVFLSLSVILFGCVATFGLFVLNMHRKKNTHND